ncbi:putative wd domain-containing protein [Erysiphe necator]|uniref:ASTRA-associated protein 1 n=1 Tax=Uncinula necator TaxID=52586 RepID=A0A0B1PCM0_UNCNE|nr:putative wd domain-containing protein [Erysiphe necator]
MSLPPPQPTYILRGHGSQIHKVTFIRSNARLVTGDVEGWVVIWDLAIKRPTAVWRAHQAPILGLNDWNFDKIITQGKDNKLLVWKLDEKDEALMSKVLPVDVPDESRMKPWLLYSLDINTVNFCSFAQTEAPFNEPPNSLLIAVPDALSSEKVEIYHLPSSAKLQTIPASSLFKGGMVMSLAVLFHPITSLLTVFAGFESGHTTINHLVDSSWSMIYIAQPHTQPILSLAVAPDKTYYLTSGADAIIAQHVIPRLTPRSIDIKDVELAKIETSTKTLNTKHAGQQDITIRNDGKIFATAGWDGRARVYSCQALRELAILKWHKEGCYAVAFAKTNLFSTEKNGSFNSPSEHIPNFCLSIDKDPAGQAQSEIGAIKSSQISSTTVVSETRLWRAHNTHWIAVGCKDGKISLWDIY